MKVKWNRSPFLARKQIAMLLSVAAMAAFFIPTSRPVAAAESGVQVSINVTDRIVPGGNFTATVNISQVTDFDAANYDVTFDPALINLNDVTPGDYFSRDGQQPVFTKNIQNDTGSAVIQLSRPPGAPGVSGAGALVTLNFQAINRGRSRVWAPNVTVRNSQGQVVGSSAPQMTVTVR